MGQVLPQDELLRQCQSWRQAGLRLVFTNGHFDLLHLGHLRYLQAAKALGDRLIVGVNGDASTRALKGPGRPLIPAVERAELLAGLAAVDAVTIFETTDAVALVQALRPDVYVKGGDYTLTPATDSSAPVKVPPEAAAVLANGGRVEFLPYLPEHSTSDLIARIRAQRMESRNPDAYSAQSSASSGQ